MAYKLIPYIWKLALIISIVKPGKSATIRESYRPISLLSTVETVLEAFLLSTLEATLSSASPKHDFMGMHSTTSAFSEIAAKIASGLNQQRPIQQTMVDPIMGV